MIVTANMKVKQKQGQEDTLKVFGSYIASWESTMLSSNI